MIYIATLSLIGALSSAVLLGRTTLEDRNSVFYIRLLHLILFTLILVASVRPV